MLCVQLQTIAQKAMFVQFFYLIHCGIKVPKLGRKCGTGLILSSCINYSGFIKRVSKLNPFFKLIVAKVNHWALWFLRLIVNPMPHKKLGVCVLGGGGGVMISRKNKNISKCIFLLWFDAQTLCCFGL